MNHQTQTLSERTNGYVGFCDCCQRFNVSFNNSLFIFSNAELRSFSEILRDKIGIKPFYTSHGKEIIVQTPMSNYYLVFTDAEINELIDMITEALLLSDANEILTNSGYSGNN